MSVPSWAANRVGIATAGWPLRGGRGTKKTKKYKKKILRKKKKKDGSSMRGKNRRFLNEGQKIWFLNDNWINFI
jgi:hypothetical protein